jgi:hypothetical protein
MTRFLKALFGSATPASARPTTRLGVDHLETRDTPTFLALYSIDSPDLFTDPDERPAGRALVSGITDPEEYGDPNLFIDPELRPVACTLAPAVGDPQILPAGRALVSGFTDPEEYGNPNLISDPDLRPVSRGIIIHF